MSIELKNLAKKVTLPSWPDRPSNGTVKNVLVALADYANKEDVAWPSVETIMRDTGFSRRSVYRALRKLEDLGFLVRVEEHVHHKATKYQLRGVRGTPLTDDSEVSAGQFRGVRGTQQRCPPDTLTIYERQSTSNPVTRKPRNRITGTEQNNDDNFFENRYKRVKRG